MKITISSFEIEVDYNTTANYRDKYNKQCTCRYCRNYYEAFEIFYPEITEHLKMFGVDYLPSN